MCSKPWDSLSRDGEVSKEPEKEELEREDGNQESAVSWKQAE